MKLAIKLFKALLALYLFSLSYSTIINEIILKHPNSLRIFHPSYPLSLLKVINEEETIKILKIKELTQNNVYNNDYNELKKLPWLTWPEFGILNENFLSNKQIQTLYEKYEYQGQFIWAYKIMKPKPGCIIINNWNKQVFYLTEYNVVDGAKGYELLRTTTTIGQYQKYVEWPPLSLEYELTANKWQVLSVSDNLINGEIMQLLPSQLPYALWELLLLLTTTSSSINSTIDSNSSGNNEVAISTNMIQALFDTGLSPKKGLISYLRLLNKIMQRAELINEIPDYRKINEKEAIL